MHRFGVPSLITALFATASALVPQISVAADPQERETMFYRYLAFQELIEGGTVQPNWMADGSSFWYARGTPDQRDIVVVDGGAGTSSPLFDVPKLRKNLAEVLGYEAPGAGLPFAAFEFLDDESKARFSVDGEVFVADLQSSEVTQVRAHPDLDVLDEWKAPRLVRRGEYTESPDLHEIPSPDGGLLLSDRDDNLWVRSVENNRSTRLTSDGVERYGWSFEGAQWSPDGLRIAATKTDCRECIYSPLVHWLGPKEEVEWWWYPDPGDPLAQPEIHVLDVLGRRHVRIDTGDERDLGLRVLGWLPDGSELLFLQTDRFFKRLDLMAADPVSGESRVVLSESRETFVEFKGFELLEGGDSFLWISERDGWAHIYLYDLDGTLVRRLTSGEFPVSSIVDVDESGGWVYSTAHGEQRVYDTHLYRVPLEGGEVVKLTEAEGRHEVSMSPSSKFFVDNHSSVTRPPSSEMRRADGKLVQVFERADIEAAAPLHRIPPEEFVVKAADGETDLWGLIYKPWDFDPQKKYPVIDHLYAGPQTTWTPRTYDGGSYGVLAHAIAQLGYVVFIVDARGTTERGKEFQDVVYGQLGRNEIPDHVSALEQLAERFPYIDAERVGVYGNSWGGYFTLRAMLLYPDVYDAGVAGAPVSDVTQYIGHEMYIGPLAENLEAYDYGSNSKIAHRLKGNLLIPIGTSDKNVRFSFTMKMADALVRADKYFDMMVLPERDHHYGYTGKGRLWHERIYFAELIRRHFQKYLPPDID